MQEDDHIGKETVIHVLAMLYAKERMVPSFWMTRHDLASAWTESLRKFGGERKEKILKLFG